MNIRLTPLSIVTALFLIAAIYFVFAGANGHYGKLFALSMAVFAVIAFFGDMVFRIFIKELKRLWLIEILFILIAAVLTQLFSR